MAVPRSLLVDELESGLYHCVSRCVRRALLLAADDDHRRDWLVERLRTLCSAFAIDVIAFAVMNNHLHLILRTLPEAVGAWSDREIAHRWLLVRPRAGRGRGRVGDASATPQDAAIDRLLAVPGRVAALRRRLSSLSWFMKELKEPIARLANGEDGVTGRFWQDRFRCHRLLDDAAVLCCATYVDLNPVKAGLADDPLDATHTSAAEHLRRAGARNSNDGDRGAAGNPATPTHELLRRLDDVPFAPAIEARLEPHLPVELPGGAAPADFADAAAAVAVPAAVVLAAASRDIESDGEIGMADSAAAAPVAAAPTGSLAATSATAATLATAANAAAATTAATERRAPARSVARRSRAVLDMTLGAYLRRLTEIARGLLGADRAEHATTDFQSILDGAHATPAMLATAYRRLRLWGSAVGSTAQLVAEALRRGSRRIVMALRLGEPDPAPD